MKKHILCKEFLYPLMFVVFTLISSPVLKAQGQFFFKEYRPAVAADHNEGRCIINIGGTLNYPNQYLAVGSYTEDRDTPQTPLRKAHAVWQWWGGFQMDKRNYVRPDDESHLELNRIDKHQVTAYRDPDPENPGEYIYTKGYPAVGTEIIKSGFPVTLLHRAWVTLIHRDNRNLLWEDFISGDEDELCEGKGVVVDALNPDRFFVLIHITNTTTGEKYFAVREYYWDIGSNTVVQGWTFRYVSALQANYDLELGGIVQDDVNGFLVVAGTVVRRGGGAPSRIFTMRIDDVSGFVIPTLSNLTLGSHSITWNGSTSTYPLLGGIYANSISANDHDDGYTIAGKIVQDWTVGAGQSAYRHDYTLPMIAHVPAGVNALTPYAYRVFRTNADYSNNDFLRGEFNYATANIHWRSGSIYCDTSYTGAGYLHDSITPLETEACMMNVNIFDQPLTASPLAAQRWCALHGPDFSQSFSTPTKTIATWFDKDDLFIDGFTYTGRQEQPGGQIRMIGGNTQKWDGFSYCSENPERVDSIKIITTTSTLQFYEYTWEDDLEFDPTGEETPELVPRYCKEGNINIDPDFPKYIDEEFDIQTGISTKSSAQLRQTQSNILLDIDISHNESIEVTIGDIVGKVLVHEQFEANKGKHTYFYETENLISGNYFLSVKIGSKRFGYTVSIIK